MGCLIELKLCDSIIWLSKRSVDGGNFVVPAMHVTPMKHKKHKWPRLKYVVFKIAVELAAKNSKI
jgi:hypothetical protein